MMREGTLLLAVLMALLIGTPVFGASFDCGKARTKIERMICADPKISALDEELVKVYKEASGLAPDPPAFKTAQQDWLRKVRGASANPEDIQAAYLARIEEIRLDPKLRKSLFAAAGPPAHIFGRYSETEPLCFNPKEGADEYDCKEDVESYIDLRPGPGNAVLVKGELWFFNGFQCGPFGGEAEWVHDVLRLPNLEDEENRCVLIMRFRDGKVFTEDPGSLCKSAFLCGANAGFHNIKLPKLTDTGDGRAKARRHRKSPASSSDKKTQ